MFYRAVGRAWLWLLAGLFIIASCTYLVTLLLIELHLATPTAVLQTATTGLRHVGRPLLDQGIALGLDKALVIFLSNLTGALLVTTAFYWVTLLDPRRSDQGFAGLRRRLQRDRSARLLQTLPAFRTIPDPLLRLTAFLLLAAPAFATATLAVITGTLIGSAEYFTGSLRLALAYLLPHGVLEISALLLAASIPLATWLIIRQDLLRGRRSAVFAQVGAFARSGQLQLCLKTVISLLWVAGVIEAHYTHRVVAMLAGA